MAMTVQEAKSQYARVFDANKENIDKFFNQIEQFSYPRMTTLGMYVCNLRTLRDMVDGDFGQFERFYLTQINFFQNIREAANEDNEMISLVIEVNNALSDLWDTIEEDRYGV